MLLSEEEYLRLKKIELSVISVISQRGDNLCWLDIYREWSKLTGIPFRPELIYMKEFMKENCSKYIDSLYEQTEYVPVWVEKNESK